ncbi:MAG: hypothetical protein NC117_00660 [Pseudoflavonifractor sp.]|nr:hypothetical protein [Pseudoflavonifractor sp.]
MMKRLLKKAALAALLLTAFIPASADAATKLYLTGSFNGWDDNSSAWELKETAAGSGSFTGKFLMPVNESNTTVFVKINKYEGSTLTAIGADSNDGFTVPLVFNTQNVAEMPLAADGKTITLTGWTEAKEVTFTVNLNTMKMTAKLASAVTEITKIYVWGAPSGYKCVDDVVLNRTGDEGRKLYKGTINVPSSPNNFRLYTAAIDMSDAAQNSLGAGKEISDAKMLTLTDGMASSPVFSGTGMWSLPQWTGGDLDFTLDLDNLTLTVLDPKTSLEVVAVAVSPYVAGVDGGVKVVADKDAAVSVFTISGAMVKSLSVPAGETTIALPAGIYIVNGQKVAVK